MTSASETAHLSDELVPSMHPAAECDVLLRTVQNCCIPIHQAKNLVIDSIAYLKLHVLLLACYCYKLH